MTTSIKHTHTDTSNVIMGHSWIDRSEGVRVHVTWCQGCGDELTETVEAL